jgi:hypothetical protein
VVPCCCSESAAGFTGASWSPTFPSGIGPARREFCRLRARAQSGRNWSATTSILRWPTVRPATTTCFRFG